MKMKIIFNYLHGESPNGVLCTLIGEIYDYNNTPNHDYDISVIDNYFKPNDRFWVALAPEVENDDWDFMGIHVDYLLGEIHDITCTNGILSGTFDIANTPSGRNVMHNFDVHKFNFYPCGEGDVIDGKVKTYKLNYLRLGE